MNTLYLTINLDDFSEESLKDLARLYISLYESTNNKYMSLNEDVLKLLAPNPKLLEFFIPELKDDPKPESIQVFKLIRNKFSIGIRHAKAIYESYIEVV